MVHRGQLAVKPDVDVDHGHAHQLVQPPGGDREEQGRQAGGWATRGRDQLATEGGPAGHRRPAPSRLPSGTSPPCCITPAAKQASPEEVHAAPRLRHQLLHNVHWHGRHVQVGSDGLARQQVVLPAGLFRNGQGGPLRVLSVPGRPAACAALSHQGKELCATKVCTMCPSPSLQASCPASSVRCSLDGAVLVQLNVLDAALHAHLAAARCARGGRAGSTRVHGCWR